jgi:predicted dehydrogenase
MTQSDNPQSPDRRKFIKHSTQAVAGATVFGSCLPKVHAADDSTIRLALIGCGNRGSGAVTDALNTRDQGPIKLYAMADLHQRRIDIKIDSLKPRFGDEIDVPSDRQFVGFDAYKHAIDVLRPGDVALCTTRAYIRPIHVEYAVKKGVNIFMEKPFGVDPMSLHHMLRVGEEAEKKGVKIAAGLQCRHSPARAALIDKINSGEMGEISYVRANRLTGRRWMKDMGEKSNNLTDQLDFGKVGLMWVGSGHMVDNLIHQIDECCWLMDDWPVSCHGMGGREAGSDDHSQNLDIYSMEFTFPNGKKALCGFRRALKGHQEFATFVHCTKKSGQFSGNIHKATVHMFKDQTISKDNIAWSPTPDAQTPWEYEWMHFVDSIRNDKPHNEAKRAVYADYASLMARAAAHTNQTVTWDQVTSSKFQFCNYLNDLNYDSTPPTTADENGYFPIPHAGLWKEL